MWGTPSLPGGTPIQPWDVGTPLWYPPSRFSQGVPHPSSDGGTPITGWGGCTTIQPWMGYPHPVPLSRWVYSPVQGWIGGTPPTSLGCGYPTLVPPIQVQPGGTPSILRWGYLNHWMGGMYNHPALDGVPPSGTPVQVGVLPCPRLDRGYSPIQPWMWVPHSGTPHPGSARGYPIDLQMGVPQSLDGGDVQPSSLGWGTPIWYPCPGGCTPLSKAG